MAKTATADVGAAETGGGSGCLGRLLRWGVAAVLVVALLFGAGAWYFSGQIGSDVLAVDPATPQYVTQVDRTGVVDAGQTVSLTPNSEQPEVSTAGTFGLRWPDGWGRLGTIVEGEGTATVTRRFTPQTGGVPADGTLAEVNKTVFIGNPRQALGLEFVDVSIKGPLGTMPAYLVPAPRSTWVIYVHGKGSTREEGYRALQTLHGLGYPGLLITYRNDVGAPADPTGEYGYGLREWQDLQAAVQYALANGADDVVLAGWSMGGAIVGQFLANSALTDKVVGLVLDSPALDMPAVISLGAEQRELPVLGLPIPGVLTQAALTLSDVRFPTDLRDAVAMDPIEQFPGPVFLAQGTQDTTVPVATADQVNAARKAASLPTIYVRSTTAEHVEVWNVDRTGYVAGLNRLAVALR